MEAALTNNKCGPLCQYLIMCTFVVFFCRERQCTECDGWVMTQAGTPGSQQKTWKVALM